MVKKYFFYALTITLLSTLSMHGAPAAKSAKTTNKKKTKPATQLTDEALKWSKGVTAIIPEIPKAILEGADELQAEMQALQSYIPTLEKGLVPIVTAAHPIFVTLKPALGKLFPALQGNPAALTKLLVNAFPGVIKALPELSKALKNAGPSISTAITNASPILMALSARIEADSKASDSDATQEDINTSEAEALRLEKIAGIQLKAPVANKPANAKPGATKTSAKAGGAK